MNEFLDKLADLMEEYGVEFDVSKVSDSNNVYLDIEHQDLEGSVTGFNSGGYKTAEDIRALKTKEDDDK